MKNKNKFKDNDIDTTEGIRTALSFLQFIENKILNKQVFGISSLEVKNINHFSEFMTLYLRK